MKLLKDMVSGGDVPPNSVKVVNMVLEMLEKGTERGNPVAMAGASLSIDPPPIQLPPRQLSLSNGALDSINWNQLVVGLDRYDARKKRLASAKTTEKNGRDLLMNRIMTAREMKGRVLYDNARER
jgi:hypothetical protein